uniref:Uncharacterized protein n=1 Tax=Arundo donax TaxID=35708 RepID=A0A0A9HQQ6_ARUDO
MQGAGHGLQWPWLRRHATTVTATCSEYGRRRTPGPPHSADLLAGSLLEQRGAGAGGRLEMSGGDGRASGHGERRHGGARGVGMLRAGGGPRLNWYGHQLPRVAVKLSTVHNSLGNHSCNGEPVSCFSAVTMTMDDGCRGKHRIRCHRRGCRIWPRNEVRPVSRDEEIRASA